MARAEAPGGRFGRLAGGANVDFGGRLDFFWLVEPLPGPLGQPWTRGRKSKRARGRAVAVVRAGCTHGAHAGARFRVLWAPLAETALQI